MSCLLDHAIYGLAWLSFGAGHSLLAHPPVRAWMARRVGAGERLAYNAIATVHIVVVLAIGHWRLGDAPGFELPAWMTGAMWVLAAVGAVVLAAGLRQYDLGRFAGTHQLRTGRAAEAAEDEPLVTTGLHRHVRHPLYSGGLALLWGLAQSPLGLATAAWGSLYLLIGTWFEERKLLARYGAAYRDYRRRVPALVPWRG